MSFILYINGIIPYILFCIWLHLLKCVWDSLLLCVSVEHSSPCCEVFRCVNRPTLFTWSTADGHLGGFLLLSFPSGAAVTLFCWTCTHCYWLLWPPDAYTGCGEWPSITYNWIDGDLWVNIIMLFIWWHLIFLFPDFHGMRAGSCFKHFAYMKESCLYFERCSTICWQGEWINKGIAYASSFSGNKPYSQERCQRLHLDRLTCCLAKADWLRGRYGTQARPIVSLFWEFKIWSRRKESGPTESLWLCSREKTHRWLLFATKGTWVSALLCFLKADKALYRCLLNNSVKQFWLHFKMQSRVGK